MIITCDELLAEVRTYAADADVRNVRRAYDLVRGGAGDSALRTVDLALQRPLAMASQLAELRVDVDTLAVGLLYPAVEDGRLSVAEVRGRFGDEIAGLIEMVERLSGVDYRGSAEEQSEAFRKMIFAMSRDLRALLVKLSDRLYQLRHPGELPARERKRVAQQTRDIYAPIANRLGIQSFKAAFEDRSFALLKPGQYGAIESFLAGRQEVNEQFTSALVQQLSGIARRLELEVEIYGRLKSIPSIHRKMRDKHMELEDVADLVALRVLTDDVASCYAMLGAIHGVFEPIDDRFKDYIGRPKSNGYQSLHTSVVGQGGERFEIQIRTREMHRVAELGIAAHWRYKEGHLDLTPAELERYSRVNQLTRIATEIQDAQEFVELVKVDLFADEVYVYTPNGDVRWYPLGATALDFAFSIHTDVGLTCVSAKANGVQVPLRYKLRSGDTMEVMTRKTQAPSRDWMRWVVTARARTKIRTFLKSDARAKARAEGAEMLDAALKERGVKLAKVVKDGGLKDVLRTLKVQDPDELYARLGYGALSLERVVLLIDPEPEPDDDELITDPQAAEDGRAERGASPIRVHEVEDMLTTFARCCRPVPGDPITGYITRGRGITIHRADCKQAQRLDPTRVLPVEWRQTARTARHVRIQVVVQDRPGMLAKITRRISLMKVNIGSCDSRTTGDGYGTAIIALSIRDLEQLERVIENLETVKGVVEVSRV